jgi:hypothetical protein
MRWALCTREQCTPQPLWPVTAHARPLDKCEVGDGRREQSRKNKETLLEHGGPLLSLAKTVWPRWLVRRVFAGHGLLLLIEAVK